ncbi:MAG: hypothetical protein P8R42_15510 [Candidatus Binatia bacterium]|nr:hypothetical protein [Candidatus Binatia bacterium]
MLNEELRQETDEVLRSHGEFLRRLGDNGFAGVAELVQRYEQVRSAAAAISRDELDAAQARVSALLEQLVAARDQIQQLSGIVGAMGVGASEDQESADPREALD